MTKYGHENDLYLGIWCLTLIKNILLFKKVGGWKFHKEYLIKTVKSLSMDILQQRVCNHLSEKLYR